MTRMNDPTAPVSPSGASPITLGSPAMWDAIASWYADAAPFFAHYADEYLRLVAPGPSARVLDVASGLGMLAKAP